MNPEALDAAALLVFIMVLVCVAGIIAHIGERIERKRRRNRLIAPSPHVRRGPDWRAYVSQETKRVA